VKYRVAWTPSAQEHLASVWLSSPDRQAVTSAAAAIDADLVKDPQSQGESRSGGVRILIRRPLGVLYEVVEEDGTVYVFAAWTTERRSR